MRYLLNPNIALRSWKLVPYAYYTKGERNAKGLKIEEFEFLCACDGKAELPSGAESPLAKRLLESDFIRVAERWGHIVRLEQTDGLLQSGISLP